MKRSEINGIMRAADAFFRGQGFHLPPFAYWSPQEWKKKGEEVAEIVDLPEPPAPGRAERTVSHLTRIVNALLAP